jgi:hypothetical protein
MDNKEKEILKLKLGLAISRIVAENREKAVQNKINHAKDHRLVSSLRKLAAASGIDFGSIQKIVVGQIGPEFVTFIGIIEALNKNLTAFGSYYDSITEVEILNYHTDLEKARKERQKKKSTENNRKLKQKKKK